MVKWMGLSVLLVSFGASGCCEDDWGKSWHDGWEDSDDGPTPTPQPSLDQRASTACDDYCEKLVICDFIAQHATSVCMDLCKEQYEADEAAGVVGTHCVSTVTCNEVEEDVCQFAPLPVDLGMSMGWGGSPISEEPEEPGEPEEPEQPEAPVCSRNHDCAFDEDCVEGSCLARCVASCQCDEGLACEAGYCQVPEAPEVVCETDCDCTSGDRCMDGICE